MEKHSLWEAILTVLANLVSKFVTESRVVLRDSNSSSYCKVTVTKPYQISEVVQTKDEVLFKIKIETAGQEVKHE